jgi:hypothetical protein
MVDVKREVGLLLFIFFPALFFSTRKCVLLVHHNLEGHYCYV